MELDSLQTLGGLVARVLLVALALRSAPLELGDAVLGLLADGALAVFAAVALVLPVAPKGGLTVARLACGLGVEAALLACWVGALVAGGIFGGVRGEVALEGLGALVVARTLARAANLSLGALDTLCLDGVALVSGLVKARIGAGLVIMALGFVVTASADLARELVRVALRGD